MQALRRQAAGGIVQQAIGAIENALLDLKARALGIPVYELFGGPVRERVRLYWSHCGTYRVDRARGHAAAAGAHRSTTSSSRAERSSRAATRRSRRSDPVRRRNPRGHMPGFARGDGFPELNPERYVLTPSASSSPPSARAPGRMWTSWST